MTLSEILLLAIVPIGVDVGAEMPYPEKFERNCIEIVEEGFVAPGIDNKLSRDEFVGPGIDNKLVLPMSGLEHRRES